MDRREFFKRGFGKVSEKAVEHVDQKLAERVNWIRPPFALPELEFLLACTRCNACIEACPHEVIFPLAAKLGPDIVKTPAMDLLNRACHLCNDWPCVTSCEPQALNIDEDIESPLPRLARVSINKETCLPYLGPECGACRDSCPVDNCLLWENEKPVINSQNCTGCSLCRDACVLDPRAINIELLKQD